MTILKKTKKTFHNLQSKSKRMADKIKKILVSFDGSKNSLKGVDLAIRLATPHDASVTIFHVVPLSHSYGFPLTNDFHKLAQRKADGIIQDALNYIKKRDVQIKSKILFGDKIGSTIVKFSSHNKFDLIVIGSRGLSSRMERFLGSVSNYVIHNSKIPVVLVR